MKCHSGLITSISEIKAVFNRLANALRNRSSPQKKLVWRLQQRFFKAVKRAKLHPSGVTMRTLAQTLRLKQTTRIATAARIAAGRGAGARMSAAPRARRAPSRSAHEQTGTSCHYAVRRLAAQVRTRRI
ncbi:hypothetical protein [Paraburkholderia nodosa]|uniref:hypothetical protein n=1 Tax=Paraburkholderia nodosa TaxID=392320 RepID=UPI00114CE7DB|nr:hypothetical protein [Paraburkholderia nodosa]